MNLFKVLSFISCTAISVAQAGQVHQIHKRKCSNEQLDMICKSISGVYSHLKSKHWYSNNKNSGFIVMNDLVMYLNKNHQLSLDDVKYVIQQLQKNTPC